MLEKIFREQIGENCRFVRVMENLVVRRRSRVERYILRPSDKPDVSSQFESFLSLVTEVLSFNVAITSRQSVADSYDQNSG